MTYDAELAAAPAIEALSDPTRRRIVSLLSHGPLRAGVLAAEAGLSAPAISRHLRILVAAGVLTDERLATDARARLFRLRPEPIAAARNWLDELLAPAAGPAGPGPAAGAGTNEGAGRPEPPGRA
jgi:DNA-binding transcriptional ArsR family regulator